MALKPGTMLGPYEVVAQIGAGVYQSRARKQAGAGQVCWSQEPCWGRTRSWRKSVRRAC